MAKYFLFESVRLGVYALYVSALVEILLRVHRGHRQLYSRVKFSPGQESCALGPSQYVLS